MNIISLLPEVYNKFIMFMLIFTRVTALFSTFTLFRANYVNSRIVISLSAMMSLYVLLLTKSQQINYDIYSFQLLIQMLMQFFVGFAAGLILNLIFEVFFVLGQIVSSQIGLTLASMFDPRFGSTTTLTHFYVIMSTLIFLYMNGHLVIIKVIIDSFMSLPLYQNNLSAIFISDILNYSSVIFSGAVIISLSLIIAVLLTNIALAIMTKFAPQINIFSIGINITLILGLFILYFTFHLYTEYSNNFIHDGLNVLQQTMTRLMK